MNDPRILAIAFLIAASIATIATAAAFIFWHVARKCRLEIRRLIGEVAGFGLSELDKHPEAIVQHLRADANMCDFAGQSDMASRLRGYASRLERWIDDKARSKELRAIKTR